MLAEAPKDIVARSLFDLGGFQQALSLAEVMNVDLIEVIVQASAVLPWREETPEEKRSRTRYPIAMCAELPPRAGPRGSRGMEGDGRGGLWSSIPLSVKARGYVHGIGIGG